MNYFSRYFEGIETPHQTGDIPKFKNVNGSVPSDDEIWDDIPEIPDFSRSESLIPKFKNVPKDED